MLSPLQELRPVLSAFAPEVGPNRTVWPGLVAYRFTRPQASQWVEGRALALCGIVQGRKRFVVGDEEYECGPGDYALLSRGMRFQTSILDATEDAPYLSFLLQLDPSVIDSVLVDLAEHQARSRVMSLRSPVAPTGHVSALDDELERAIAWFLRSLSTDSDRRVLAPMRLREITYRLMQLEQRPRLLQAAVLERDGDPVRRVMRYIDEHLSESLSVGAMARHVALSPSALTARFVEATGMGPYQYAKRMRLDRARALLVADELTVSQVARDVGYSSLSYFINEFKRQFAVTPGAYARSQRESVAMRVEEVIA